MNPIKGFVVSAGLTAAAAIAVLSAPTVAATTAAPSPASVAVTASSDDSGDSDRAQNRRVEVRI
ncbi:MAG: hypothetical protein SW019_07640 [Actinomycetota bacterium]|nr:hypothetical protein [Actinomycetota bacterium]